MNRVKQLSLSLGNKEFMIQLLMFDRDLTREQAETVWKAYDEGDFSMYNTDAIDDALFELEHDDGKEVM